VQYILPAFRSLVAKELIEKHNFSQVAAADKLGTTQAAISQYLSSKRGDKRVRQLEAIPAVQSTAREVARGIATGKLSQIDAMLKVCKLCMALRTQDAVCNLHRDFVSLPKLCDICPKIYKRR
jgi:predicted transcriptional regulator